MARDCRHCGEVQCIALQEPECSVLPSPKSITAPAASARANVSLRQNDRVRTPEYLCPQSTYRSCSSLREWAAVQCKSKPERRRATALRHAWSYPLRSRTNCSSWLARSALTDEPSSAARMRASRSRSSSTFNVMFDFKLAPASCCTILRALCWQFKKNRLSL